MNVDSVCIFLNKDDGSQLAMLVQEKFQMDLKVSSACILVILTLLHQNIRISCWLFLLFNFVSCMLGLFNTREALPCMLLLWDWESSGWSLEHFLRNDNGIVAFMCQV